MNCHVGEFSTLVATEHVASTQVIQTLDILIPLLGQLENLILLPSNSGVWGVKT